GRGHAAGIARRVTLPPDRRLRERDEQQHDGEHEADELAEAAPAVPTDCRAAARPARVGGSQAAAGVEVLPEAVRLMEGDRVEELRRRAGEQGRRTFRIE